MSATKAGPFHAGLTPERVVAAAAQLTRESHLMSWSIRDLAGRLGIAVSGVYHHVGGKDLLCSKVVDQVLDQIELPDPRLPWQEWFRELLYVAGPSVAAYPGTATWILTHGPFLPAVLPVLDAGMAALDAAGFGEQAPFAFAVLFNNAMLTVSMGDDRRRHEDDALRDHAPMMSEFDRLAIEQKRSRAMMEDFVSAFAPDGGAADRLHSDYYRLVVDTTIAGLDARRGRPAEQPDVAASGHELGSGEHRR